MRHVTVRIVKSWEVQTLCYQPGKTEIINLQQTCHCTFSPPNDGKVQIVCHLIRQLQDAHHIILQQTRHCTPCPTDGLEHSESFQAGVRHVSC